MIENVLSFVQGFWWNKKTVNCNREKKQTEKKLKIIQKL